MYRRCPPARNQCCTWPLAPLFPLTSRRCVLKSVYRLRCQNPRPRSLFPRKWTTPRPGARPRITNLIGTGIGTIRNGSGVAIAVAAREENGALPFVRSVGVAFVVLVFGSRGLAAWGMAPVRISLTICLKKKRGRRELPPAFASCRRSALSPFPWVCTSVSRL